VTSLRSRSVVARQRSSLLRLLSRTIRRDVDVAAEKPERELTSESHAIKVAREPFAAGNLRYARHGRIMDGTSSDPWRPCIFKDFKARGAKQQSLTRYLMEMEVNSVASALAERFNEEVGPPAHRRMRYVLASVASTEHQNYFVEEVLDGTFTRYSYNTGYWEEDLLDEWLLRFALWTHKVTSGFLMVTDLQGVLTDEGYVLTDPVILCRDLSRFGNTNLGPEMMERCKSSAEHHLKSVSCS